MIDRLLLKQMTAKLDKGKVLVLVGARQVGKTTLTKQLVTKYPADQTLFLNGDNLEAQRLSKMDFAEIDNLMADYRCILIDEAHKVGRIGDITKSLVDKYGSDKQLILTGSSTVNLIDQTSEPLTGRKRVFKLFPISLKELGLRTAEFQIKLNQLITYGLYPEVVTETSQQDKLEAVKELAESSLYRDVLDITGARASGDLVALLRYLALHIGQTISINEISLKLSIDRRTIDRYIDLLSKSFIVFPLMPYSKTDASVRRSYKVYFWDTGIRNALIDDFSALNQRLDAQALWQNFVIAERMKQANYNQDSVHYHFWRSYDGAEVDLVEIRNQQLHGLKISYNGKYIRESANFNKLKPKSWHVITPQDFNSSLKT